MVIFVMVSAFAGRWRAGGRPTRCPSCYS